MFSFARTVLTAVHVCSEAFSVGRLSRGEVVIGKGVDWYLIGSDHYWGSRINPSNPDSENSWEDCTKSKRRTALFTSRSDLGRRRWMV